jgi:hypothetical protein
MITEVILESGINCMEVNVGNRKESSFIPLVVDNWTPNDGSGVIDSVDQLATITTCHIGRFVPSKISTKMSKCKARPSGSVVSV